jgi:hypothetical protein
MTDNDHMKSEFFSILDFATFGDSRFDAAREQVYGGNTDAALVSTVTDPDGLWRRGGQDA